MSIKPLAPVGSAQAAIKTIAFYVALWCAGGLSPSLAQTGALKAGAVAGRNLQVQAVVPPSVNNTQRVALVIGNSAYKDAPLSNPVNDARAIAKALQESGFSVIARENADQRGMLDALREFGDRLRGGGTGLFYYAGHGMQIKDRNYLIPVGAAIEREDEVAYSAVDAQAVLDKMEAAGNVANIMILDACRNNPFTRSSRSGKAGLAQMDAPVGTLVAYATAPGSVASDGSGANGLYTQHLLSAIRQPGSKVEDVFKQVRANVRRDSQGKQVPWEATSLEGDFYFKGGPLVATPVDSSLAVESALWDAVKASTVPIELRAYLNRYPGGKFATEARSRLASLQPLAAVASVPAPAPQKAAPTAPEAGKASRPAAVINKAGFTVGDRWRFQVVDKFKGEVVRNYSQSVDSVLPDGSLGVNKGSARWDANGNLRFERTAARENTFSAGFIKNPVLLQTGAKTELNYEVDKKFTDGRTEKEQTQGTMVVKNQEMVKTPAGEFNAWRVEIEAFWQMQHTHSGGRWLFTGWYVPELRAYVAFDDESRNANNSFNWRNRHELTSFSVRGADNFAQR